LDGQAAIRMKEFSSHLSQVSRTVVAMSKDRAGLVGGGKAPTWVLAARLGRRASSAAGRHDNRPRRQRTRAARKAAALKEDQH